MFLFEGFIVHLTKTCCCLWLRFRQQGGLYILVYDKALTKVMKQTHKLYVRDVREKYRQNDAYTMVLASGVDL